jgi:UDP-N-acetylmuramoyl-tripeptide--D-alanyl-D-alanine ligase
MDITSLYSAFQKHQLISTDTRKITPGCIFFALKGDQYDGNRFAREALDAGAALAVVSDPNLKDERFFLVDDTLLALQQLAHEHRRHLSIPVIAITGSNGKTTTKELIASILSAKYKVHATAGNLNNHIGVPLTLLQTPVDTEILVCEMGANHIGEIAALCKIAEPTHGIITNIGRAHLEGFGGFDGVKRAKGELFEFLRAHEGFAFVNADDASLAEISLSLKNKLTYGLKDKTPAQIHFRFIAQDGHSGFKIQDRNSGMEISSTLFGHYNAINLVAAYTIGKYFAVEDSDIQNQLEHFISGSNRSEVVKWKGCTIIKDAYNANPSSMELALQAFSNQYPHGWVVLGDMKELGEETSVAHQQILALVQIKPFEKIWLIGEAFAKATEDLHIRDDRIRNAKNIEEVKENWTWANCDGKAILLKGSRSMHLEELLD